MKITENCKMWGAIIGDICGSVYEINPTKRIDIELFPPNHTFTDDSVLTCAIASCLIEGHADKGCYQKALKEFASKYPRAGYGAMFASWAFSDAKKPYGSFGNGAAMRVSPIGFAFNTEEDVLHQAKLSAEITHNHPEGIKGAQSVALAILYARKGSTKEEIRRRIGELFGYDLNRTVEEIRPSYRPTASAPDSVPEAIIAFLDSDSFEHAIRLAISLGGDADTQACIAGAIAEAYYGGVPAPMKEKARNILDEYLLSIIEAFTERYPE